MSKITIEYQDITLGALNNCSASQLRAEKLSDLSAFPKQDITPINYATFEPNKWLLDKSKKIFSKKPAFWSDKPSDGAGIYSLPVQPALTFTFDTLYTITGITLNFGQDRTDICTEVSIEWSANGKLIKEITYFPDDVSFFCPWEKEIPIDTIKVKFVKTAVPMRYVKIVSVAFGSINKFTIADIQKASLQVDGDLISNKMPVSTLSWTLNSNVADELTFRNHQPVYTYDNDELLSVTYLKEIEKVDAGIYNIKNVDIIGVLNDLHFDGKIYKNVNAGDAIREILKGATQDFSYPITFGSGIEEMTLNGYIKSGTKKEALQQICFSLNACATSFRNNGLRVFAPFGARPLIIPTLEEEDIFTGQKLIDKEAVSSVSVLSHSLKEDQNGTIEIGGKKYSDTTIKHTRVNRDIMAQERGKAFEVSDMTLVNESNVEDIRDMLYDYLMLKSKMKAKIVLGDRDIGKMVDIPTLWGVNTEGIISSMNIKLSNLTVADIETEVTAQ